MEVQGGRIILASHTTRAGQPPVLLTWGESRMALAATRALGRAGLPVAVLAEQAWAPAWRSRFCTEAVQAPDADSGAAYADFLAQRLRARPHSGLFFCDDRTALLVGRQRERFAPLVPFLLPEQRHLELTLDKNAMMAFAREHGIGLPLTAWPSGADDLERACRGMRYPLLVKGSGGFASSHLRIVHAPAQARAAYAEMEREQQLGGFTEPPHLQEYVEGTVFSALALCRQGEPLGLFQMRKHRTFPVWGGVCVEAESVHEPELERAARALLAVLPWHGVIEIEFVRDRRDGRFLLIEPSPDPNWGLDLAIASGMNVPLQAWRLMQGQIPSVADLRYRVGQRFVWMLPEGLLHLRARPRSAWPLLWRNLDPRVAADWRQGDAGPLRPLLGRTRWLLGAGR